MSVKEALVELQNKLLAAVDRSLAIVEEEGLDRAMASLVTKVGLAAAELKGIVIGMGETQQPLPSQQPLTLQSMMETARQEAQQAKRQANIEEGLDPKYALCVDGPAEGTYVPVHPKMEPGNFTRVDGAVYELTADCKLRLKTGGS